MGMFMQGWVPTSLETMIQADISSQYNVWDPLMFCLFIQVLTSEDTQDNVYVPVVRDTWVTDSLLVNKQSNSFHKNKFVSSPKSSSMEGYHDADPSYFEVYKNKMKKLKAAGLQADAQMINSINPSMGFRNSLSDADQKYMKLMASNKKAVAQPKGERSGSKDILLPLPPEHMPDDRVSPTSGLKICFIYCMNIFITSLFE